MLSLQKCPDAPLLQKCSNCLSLKMLQKCSTALVPMLQCSNALKCSKRHRGITDPRVHDINADGMPHPILKQDTLTLSTLPCPWRKLCVQSPPLQSNLLGLCVLWACSGMGETEESLFVICNKCKVQKDRRESYLQKYTLRRSRVFRVESRSNSNSTQEVQAELDSNWT
jgi:hypothetical protein